MAHTVEDLQVGGDARRAQALDHAAVSIALPLTLSAPSKRRAQWARFFSWYEQRGLTLPAIRSFGVPWVASSLGLLAQKLNLATVNAELIGLYWRIGCDILERQQRDGWGAKVAVMSRCMGRTLRQIRSVRAGAYRPVG